MKILSKVALAVGIVGAGALAGAVAGETTQNDFQAQDAFLQRYTKVLRLVEANAPLEVEPSDLVYSSIDGFLGMLDPHTNFLPPEMFAKMRERQQGSFHGIGVIISLRGDKVTVITPIEGSPAARLGLRAGDVIEAVDGTSTDGMDLDDVASRLRGPEGSTVHVTISRPGLPEPLEVTIERARVPSESVRYAFMLGGDTAYIRISDFTRTTGAEVRNALQRLVDEGATRLLLDLRDNPGGIVDAAVEVASIVLKPGAEVFSTKGRTGDSFQDYRAESDGIHFQGPLIVLMNRGSASAAEIVAGAIQDHDRGLIVGETSFGKGVVQTIYPVRDAGLALTTARYYTPSGRCIQRDFDSFFSYIHPEVKDQQPEGSTAAPPAAVREPPQDREVFFTDSGRKVYGGGGIVPDDFVALGQYSPRLAKLVGHQAFFQFAVQYLAPFDDKAAAARDFEPTPEVIDSFRKFVVEHKDVTPEEIDLALQDPTDRRDIEVGLRYQVLSAGVSLNAGFRAFTASDDQIQAALKLFGEASKLQARTHDERRQERAAALERPR